MQPTPFLIPYVSALVCTRRHQLLGKRDNILFEFVGRCQEVEKAGNPDCCVDVVVLPVVDDDTDKMNGLMPVTGVVG